MSRMPSIPRLSACRWGGLLLLFALNLSTLQSADPEIIKATSEWSGSSETETLEKIAPLFLTTQEGFGILWKAWSLKGEIPTVDFTESVVVVSTTRGSRLQVSYALDEKDNLAVRAIATRDLRPGFRYHVAVVPRAGVISINGTALPALPRLAGPALPVAKPYIPETTLTGSLRLEGSVTMSHLLELWSAGFQKFHPKLKITTKGGGSESANPEYAEGEATLAFMSRPVGVDELGVWEKKTNLRMMAFPICEDDIALIVHKDNPIKQLTMNQLKVIFGASKQQATWGNVGLTDTWATKPIALNGRDDQSGTRTHLRRVILGDGEESSSKTHKSYSSIVEAVAADLGAIGYTRELFVKETVRSVPIVIGTTPQPFLRRTCTLVVAVPEGKPIPPLVKEFLVFIYRAEGQTQLFHDGFDALSKEVMNLQLERLGIDEIK